MAAEQPVRIGIVGAGGIVRRRHLPGLAAIDGVSVIAVCNRSEESASEVAAEWAIPDVTTDWRELVERDDLDAILIGAWPYLHCPVTVASLDAGKHVFCQARMARYLDEARRMLDAAEVHDDLVTMLCPPPHGLAGDRVMQELLAGDTVGEVRMVRLGSLSGAYADPAEPLSWRQDAELSGRNVLALGIYAEVLQRWLGPVASVDAEMQTYIAERPREAGSKETVAVEIPDSLTVAGQMASGGQLSITMSGVTPQGPADTLEVYGDRGAIVYDFAADAIRVSRDDGPWEPVEIPDKRRRQWTVEADFIDAIRTGCEVHPDFRDGVGYMELVEAVWQSHEHACRVNLPLEE